MHDYFSGHDQFVDCDCDECAVEPVTCDRCGAETPDGSICPYCGIPVDDLDDVE